VYDLKQMIKNELEKDKGLAAKLAQVAGLANPSPLYKFLNESQREMNDFKGLLEIVRYLFMDREKEIMHDYILTLDPNGKCARVSLEYAICNRMHDLAYKLIAKLSECKNTESREWANLYFIDRQAEEGKITLSESVDAVNGLKLKSVESQAIGKMIRMYAYHGNRMIDMMFEMVTGLEEQIKKLNDDYLRFSYLCRLGILMLSVNLHLDNVEEARRYGKVVLDNTTQESLRYLAYLQLGNTYSFDSAEKALDYLNQARLICKELKNNEHKMKQVERSISFVQNYWGLKPEYLKHDSVEIAELHEIAFFHIRNGEYEKSIKILDGITDMSDHQKGFHFFYRGIISKDKENFYQSVMHFKLSGEKFYRKISLIELEKLGENKIALMAFSV
jgi:hypothetical protein